MKPKIIVVDDDGSMLAVLAAELESEGTYDVFPAASAAEGFQLARELEPDLIVSDYYMPGEDGFSFCRRVKQDDVLRHTMFLLLTAEDRLEWKVEGLDTGADEYLTKPFKPEELLAHVRSLIRIKTLRDELLEERAELARVNLQLEASLNSVLKLLGELIGVRVPNASLRAERAVEVASWLGQRLKLAADEERQVLLAARLREIGKLNVADETLKKKPAELSPTERESIVHVPVYAEMVVSTIPQLRDVASVLRSQMENYDGTGYPDKLIGAEIPMPSRILRACNMLDQLQAEGVTKVGEIMEHIERVKSTVLDPGIAQLLMEYLQVYDDPTWSLGKRQVNVFELAAGMKLACDIFTGKGLKLLQKETIITSSHVERILSHHELDPIINAIYIYE